MLRFAALLAEGLTQVGELVTLIQPPQILGRLFTGYPTVSKWLAYVDKFLFFPPVLVRACRSATLVHICDHSNAMYGRWTLGKPWVVTCHDMLAIRSALGEFPQNRPGRTGRIMQKWILRWLTLAPKIACISNATREDVLRLANRPSESSEVVYMGLNYPFLPLERVEWEPVVGTLLKRRNSERLPKYLLHIGADVWYKNRPQLVEMFLHVRRLRPANDLQLVLVGPPLGNELQSRIAAEAGLDNVHIIRNLSGKELNALYAGAECLVFPSVAEGFGWPVIEAQASGCPVVTSDRAPLNEIGGTNAIYVDPDNPRVAALRIIELIEESHDQRASRVAAGLAHAAKYSKMTMVEQYVRIYQGMLKSA
jgi:glycosyltransferase involved in cell wall biosynthesis